MNHRALQDSNHPRGPHPGPLLFPCLAAGTAGSWMEWADTKLFRYEETMADVVVELKDPSRLTLAERTELLRRLRKLNFVVYQSRPGRFTKRDLKRLGAQLGLARLDNNLCADRQSVSSVRVVSRTSKPRYIPYTDRPLGWHTDGYYNAAEKAIRSFILHCVRPAPEGGENYLLDPEIVYLLLYERAPEHAAVLADPESFSIPAGPDPAAEPESGRTGPVFGIDPATGALHMRYTGRQRSISWNPRPEVRAAAQCLGETIGQAARYTVRHKLAKGQGIICNNVLHKRAGFADGASAAQRRLMYRARYYDRVAGT